MKERGRDGALEEDKLEGRLPIERGGNERESEVDRQMRWEGKRAMWVSG